MSSSNIVSLSGQRFQTTLPEPPSPMDIVHALRALWVASVITQDAYFLGTLVCQAAQAAKAREVTVNHETAAHALVKANGAVFTGPVSKDRIKFIQALQGLHFSAGITNHYNSNLLDEADAGNRHFTRSPEVGSDSVWSSKTTIFFRLPTMSKGDYDAGIAELYQGALAHIKGSVNLDVRG